ncbi:hypothetical protein FNX44_009460, partial [Streptomyces sp. OF1]|nr:hypothetical protein [Streptomyces alkaliterrae]
MSENAELVGTCYTRARLWPKVVGKLPGGGRMWGGPYTVPQLAVLVGVFVVMLYSQAVWARFGLLVNLALIVAVPYGLALVVRRLEAAGRAPGALVWG